MLEKPHGSQNFQWIYLKHMNALWGGGMSHSMLIQLVQAGQNIAGDEVKTWGVGDSPLVDLSMLRWLS